MHTSVSHQPTSPHAHKPCQQDALPTLPAIPLPSEELVGGCCAGGRAAWECEEKVIPGYNFESLFRKKSHIRLARKKNKEEARRSSSVKAEQSAREAKHTQKGHWSSEENKLYHWFLELHSRHFVLKYLRRTDKIFKSMAHFIRTREAEQCRSHHQKMEKKYHTFHQILIKLRMDSYNTLAPDLLRLELEENGYKLRDCALITEQELRNAHLARPEPRSEEERSQNSSNLSA